jgi:tetratricopeptide (TPR) repeat protein
VAAEPPDRLADRLASGRVRDKVLGLLCDWSFQAGVPDGGDPAERDRTAAVVRLVRQRAGGALARWQAARDAGDRNELVRLAADPAATALAPELVLELSRNLETVGAFAERVALLRRAADRYPTHVWVRENLAEACLAHQPPLAAEALWHAGAAAAIRPDSALCLMQVGKALRLSREYARAAEVFWRTARLSPNSGTVRNELGVCRLLAGDPAGAVDALRAAAELSPGNAVYRSNLADALLQTGDVDGALAACGEADRLGAGSSHFADVLARACLELLRAGRAAEAEPLLRRALAIRERVGPAQWTTANARSMLGEALAAQGKHAEAGPLLRRGFDELTAREASIPLAVRGDRLREAAGRLVRLAEATGDTAAAARWRAERAKYPPPVEPGPPPRKVG